MTVLERIASAALKTRGCRTRGTAGLRTNAAFEVVPDAAVVETVNYTGRRVEQKVKSKSKTRTYLLLVARQD